MQILDLIIDIFLCSRWRLKQKLTNGKAQGISARGVLSYKWGVYITSVSEVPDHI